MPTSNAGVGDAQKAKRLKRPRPLFGIVLADSKFTMDNSASQTATVQRVARIWEPSTVLPSQLPTNNGRAHRPELHLVSAIFEDALHCVMHQGDARRGRKRREFLAACDWFWNEDRHWPFAFTNVCDLLALDGAAVRATLRARIVAQRSATAAPAARPWSRRALRRPADAPPTTPRALYEITMWDEV